MLRCSAQLLLNTPPVFAIYVAGLVAQHLLAQGGLAAAETRNREAPPPYAAIDNSEGFYRGAQRRVARMNVTFRLLHRRWRSASSQRVRTLVLIGLAGHRMVGGMRASLYNAVSLEAVRTLVEFMEDFQQRFT